MQVDLRIRNTDLTNVLIASNKTESQPFLVPFLAIQDDRSRSDSRLPKKSVSSEGASQESGGNAGCG
jgi:hypothetical protein